MCGICGIFGNGDVSRVERMVSAMHHRGPDDAGVFHQHGVALGMARLAILDISQNGHQPMQNHDASVWIVYNGEMYNFQEERDILCQKGHTFRSGSDTEVVLRMYETYGDDFLLRMRGMFALAIYDKRRGPGKERLLLARDHLGIKPLLYARHGNALVFASEMKAMLASGLIPGEFDPEALRLLLTYGSVPQPMTAVSGVEMLLPGHRLIIDESAGERLERFWRLDRDRISGLRQRPYEELLHTLKESLEASVRMQMISDVPIGAFLSGGVDSSLLVAMMAGISNTKVKTFSVGFEQEGADIDESDDAQQVAKFIGTDHSRVLVTGQEVRERITHIATALDQPSVDGVNAYFVSLAARQAVTVAISGTGGDELFAGYPWFANMVRACHLDSQTPRKSAIRRVLSRMAQREIFNPLLSDGRLGIAMERLRGASGFVSRYARQYQVFGAHGTMKVLSPDMRQRVLGGREPAHDLVLADELPSASPVERVSALCLRGYTQNQLLRDIDTVSMAHGLEVRVPFLDPVLADVAFSLPDSTKLGDVTRIPNPAEATYAETGGKKILIDAGRNLLPQGMGLQQKRGFGMPFDEWLRGPLRDVLDDTLSPDTVRRRGFFNPDAVRGIHDRYLSKETNWLCPWLLMITELWCRNVLENPGTDKEPE